MGKRERAEDKGKGEDDELIGIIKRVAISTSSRRLFLRMSLGARPNLFPLAPRECGEVGRL
jgi:hypothetical protein